MKKLKELNRKYRQLVREAEKFRSADGTFKDDQTRATFDAKMAEAEAVDIRIRSLEDEDEDDEELPLATETERQRGLDIRAAVAKANLTDGDKLADEHIKKGTTTADFRALLFEELTKKDAKTRTDGTTQVLPGEDARDKFARGVGAWLVRKAGVTEMYAKGAGVGVEKVGDGGEFRGMSMIEIGRMSLELAGVKTRGLDKQELARQILSYRSATQTASDFTTALESVMNKTLLGAYAIQPDTWTKFCKRGSVSDFRPSNRYRRGSFGRLDNLNELGEFKNKPITDAEKQTISAGTVGNIVALSRQALINDDMGFFTDVLTAMGRAAKLSPEIDIYALLALNAGLGPLMSDGNTLFHASHNNITTGAAISAAAFDADRVAMASQKDKDGNDFVDLRPAILLIAVGLGGQSKVINGSQYDPDTVANKSQMKPNIVVGLFREIVDTPRLSGTRRYLFADPTIAPTLEVVFLDGQSEPVLESKEGFRVDGMEWRVRYDYGVGGIDFRGAITNAGA